MNKIKQFFKNFFSIDDTPHHIAAGVALGMFWGIMPGEGVLTTLATASLLRFNRSAALAGVIATNNWVSVLILPLAAGTGGFLFHESPSALASHFHQTYDLGYKAFLAKIFFLNVALPLIVGFLVLSVSISVLAYIIFYLLLEYQKIKIR